jgi:heme exporter protein A
VLSPISGHLSINSCPREQLEFPLSHYLNYIAHQHALKSQCTVAEQLTFWQQIASRPKICGIEELAQKLNLSDVFNTPCALLSAGQKHKVSLARLWLQEAELWLLDEPFSALDQHSCLLLQQHIEQHVAANGAVILVSHQGLNFSKNFRTFDIKMFQSFSENEQYV